MKIYTKTGDGGQTSLYDGSRALKSSIAFQVLGEIDEFSARIGGPTLLIQTLKLAVWFTVVNADQTLI